MKTCYIWDGLADMDLVYEVSLLNGKKDIRVLVNQLS